MNIFFIPCKIEKNFSILFPITIYVYITFVYIEFISLQDKYM